MENKITQLVLAFFQKEFSIAIEEKNIQFQKTKKEFEGDTTLVLFPFLKITGSKPNELGEKIGAFLLLENTISSFSTVGGFLNVSFSLDYWFSKLTEIEAEAKYGYSAPNSKSAIMVEYSSPNTNKPLHLGHLRNISLGFSVAKILAANGHEVIKTQIINDRGIHICKSMLAWQKFSPLNEKGERETPQNTSLKGDKLVGKYYVEFDKRFNAEAKEIIQRWRNNDFSNTSEAIQLKFEEFENAKIGKEGKAIEGIEAKIKDLAKNETEILREAKNMLVRWEGRDPEVYLLWTTMNGWVYEGFNVTYNKLGVDFDKLYYESETFILGKDLVQEGLSKGVFYQNEDSSVWIDLSKEGLDQKLLLRSDGTSVYMTQDLGTAVDRFNDFPQLEGMVYTVGNEQDYHFQVLFLILKKLGYSWAESCFHLSYGMVDLPEGKMKSREGTVVDADDLIDSVIASAKEMTAERGHIEGMSSAEKEHLFKTIGLGGLKYFLLKVDPKKRMLFNPEESIELNGHTGPFIQYAHARIQSLLEKGGKIDTFTAKSISSIEKELIKTMATFPVVLTESGKEHSPALLANFIYELVKQYNQFYQTVPILNDSTVEEKALRLCISKNVAKITKNGMELLGIEVPNKM